MTNEFLYKKAYFQCARRAMLENEVFMKKFIEEKVKDVYSNEKLDRLNTLLTNMDDNDMFNLIMGVKSAESFKEQYDYEICKEIEIYAESVRGEG